MKRSIAVAALCIMAVFAFAGCNKEKEEAGSGAGKYVTLGEYKGLEVTVNDTTVTDAQNKMESLMVATLQELEVIADYLTK